MAGSFTRLGADDRLYRKLQAVQAGTDAARLSPARRQALANSCATVLDGAELQGEARTRHAAIRPVWPSCRSSSRSTCSTRPTGTRATPPRPSARRRADDVRRGRRAAAVADGRDDAFKLTLHMPSYYPVLQYAESRSLRERLYRAYATRASELGPAALDNSAAMQEILALRQGGGAPAPGMPTSPNCRSCPRWPARPEQVIAFLRDLGRRPAPRRAGPRRVARLRARPRPARSCRPGTWPSRRRSACSSSATRSATRKSASTSPSRRSLDGLFRVVETLFEVAIREDRATAWHPSVRFFRIERDGELVGRSYLDPYARPGKRSGAWMDEVRGRWTRPTACCRRRSRTWSATSPRRSPSTAGCARPADARRPDDAVPRVRPRPAPHADAGRRHRRRRHLRRRVGCPRAAEPVHGELCWEWKSSSSSAPRRYRRAAAARPLRAHARGAQLPERPADAAPHQYALADMRLHAEPGSERDIQALVDEVRREVAVVPAPAFNRYQHAVLAHLRRRLLGRLLWLNGPRC